VPGKRQKRKSRRKPVAPTVKWRPHSSLAEAYERIERREDGHRAHPAALRHALILVIVHDRVAAVATVLATVLAA
jgi:hypothetical protein